jgi:hypothetical protein
MPILPFSKAPLGGLHDFDRRFAGRVHWGAVVAILCSMDDPEVDLQREPIQGGI